jgi:hypothetical protein
MISNSVLYAQAPKSLYVAKRITEAPDIDGFIGEEVWDMAEIDSVAIQYAPYNKKRATERTIFRILYDDKALYVAAILYDNPDSILAGLGRRDDAFDINADQFIIDIGPYNDGINSFSFMVSSSGVQSDFKNYFDTRDLSWDAVWVSKTQILERGWIVEMKIPYSAIRFSKNIFQVWSLNVFRIVKRKEETSSWNFVDRDIVGTTNQAGELIGIENVKAPFRLSATPYLTAYLEKDAGANKWNNYYKAGFDLKYGINQSFTLDASVLPDYGQVEYDDVVLNVSPFETKYPEHRQFFSEEAEMFSKANIFYSRRIGLDPELYNGVRDSLRNNETITENPSELDVISSVKLTGRNSRKFGLGVINTICRPSFALVSDTLSGLNREIQTQSFTNYNVIVIDKTLENNSFISLINTNLTRDNLDYIANVTGTEFRLSNRKRTYSISGIAAVSQMYDSINGTELGYKTNLYLDKISGKFQFRIGNEIISQNYNQNDMGYLPYVNEVSSFSRFDYNIFEPFWEVLSWKSSIEFRYSNLYEPQSFTDFRITLNSAALFSNQLSFSIGGFWRPLGNHDYYEAREPGRVFTKAESWSAWTKLGTDPRKMVSVNLMYKYWGNNTNLGMVWHTIGVAPLIRIQSRFQLGFNLFYDKFNNSIGHVYTINDSIYLGKRHLETFLNTLTFLYSFTNKAWLNLKVRHYWSTARNNLYYTLKDDGKLNIEDTYPYNADKNFEMLNLDFSIKWEFAPGSQLSFVWKNLFTQNEYPVSTDYFRTFDEMINSPHYNNFSIRFLYYLDFLYLKGNGK